MSNHKIIPVPAQFPLTEDISTSRFMKIKQFATQPDAIKYMGRTVIVISLIVAACVIYKNRSKIYASCQKATQAVKNCFKRKESDGTLLLPTHVHEVNIHVLHDSRVTIYRNPKEPGAEGEGKSAKEVIPESSRAATESST